MKNIFMKLSKWADNQGISYLTAYRWFKDGKLPVKAYQSDSGTIIVEEESDQKMMVQQHNSENISDAIFLFLKKTIEYSKNNSSLEDFAAYILSNFKLQLNTSGKMDGPRYSKNKPKPEDIQKHFQQFIPKTNKPKPDVILNDKISTDPNQQNLFDELTKALESDAFGKIKTQLDSQRWNPAGLMTISDAITKQLNNMEDIGMETMNEDENTLLQIAEENSQTNNVFDKIPPLVFGPTGLNLYFKPTQKELNEAVKTFELINLDTQPKVKRTRKKNV